MVINLIANAVKFTPEGTVTVGVSLVGSNIQVSVKDSGIGIVPADHDKVFEKFKQVGDTLTDKPRGTGARSSSRCRRRRTRRRMRRHRLVR